MMFLDMYKHGIQMAELFWGLWLIPLGLLVYKSGFAPKVLGILIFVGCFGHLLTFLSTFLFPGYSAIFIPISETVMLGELPIFLWLLIKGIKDQKPALVEVDRETPHSIQRREKMNINRLVVKFATVFVVTLLTVALVTFLWNLIGHGESAADWETCFRFAAIFGFILT
jgi:hypothetical protein